MSSGLLTGRDLTLVRKVAKQRARKKASQKQKFYDFIGTCGEFGVLRTFPDDVSSNVLKPGCDGGIDGKFVWGETFDVKATTQANPHLILPDGYKYVANYLILVHLDGVTESNFLTVKQVPYNILGWTDTELFQRNAQRHYRFPGTLWMERKFLFPSTYIFNQIRKFRRAK